MTYICKEEGYDTMNSSFLALIMANVHYILAAITLFILLALVIFININYKLSKMNKRYHRLMQGMEGANIEKILMAHIDEIRESVKKVDELNNKCQALERTTRECVQKVGIVRFNAFEDTGSDLSFAVALLNAENSGIVLSAIYGRNETRTYAKPIVAGESSYFLTNEEKQALKNAKEKILEK